MAEIEHLRKLVARAEAVRTVAAASTLGASTLGVDPPIVIPKAYSGGATLATLEAIETLEPGATSISGGATSISGGATSIWGGATSISAFDFLGNDDDDNAFIKTLF